MFVEGCRRFLKTGSVANLVVTVYYWKLADSGPWPKRASRSDRKRSQASIGRQMINQNSAGHPEPALGGPAQPRL